jgi:hypothetical protein
MFKPVVRQSALTRLNDEGITCEYCGKVLTEVRSKSSTRTCNNKCRVALTWERNKEAEETKLMLKAQGRKHDRKCQVCGEPCFPNYFWCFRHQPEEYIDPYATSSSDIRTRVKASNL